MDIVCDESRIREVERNACEDSSNALRKGESLIQTARRLAK
jgi:hypothetical protein